MQKLFRDDCIYALDRDEPPKLRVKEGEHFRMETYDARRGRLQTKDQVLTSAPSWGTEQPQTNPYAGPVYIEGVSPGDVLKVSVHDVAVAPRGYVVHKRDSGVAHKMVAETVAVFADVNGDQIDLDCGISIPLRPHIGSLGVTPADKIVATGFAGRYGGNMDCRFLDNGSDVFLPVFVRGALLGAGDLHASMGGGELQGQGIEISGEVELSAKKVPGLKLDCPVIRHGDELLVIGVDRDLRLAIEYAATDMVQLLMQYGPMNKLSALSLLTTVCDTSVCQSCDPAIFGVVSVSIDKKFVPEFCRLADI
jgi:amidase